MAKTIQIGNHTIGEGYPTYIIGEIGINHNGDMEVTKELIRRAKKAGVDAIKLQKRTPELCVPVEQRDQMRDTPWGYITYMAYREKVEFGKEEYKEIDRYCKEQGIDWFVSVWDEEAVDFMEQFNPVCYKAPSASLTDLPLLRKMRATGDARLSSPAACPQWKKLMLLWMRLDKIICCSAIQPVPTLARRMN